MSKEPDTKTFTDEEVKQMEADMKKSLDKENQDLVAKTIAETKEKLEKEKRFSEMEEQMKTIQAEKEAEKEKYANDLEALKTSFKEESEKMVREFQDSRQSTVNNNNPFKKDTKEADDILDKYKNDEDYRKSLDVESRKKFAEYTGIPERLLM